MTPIEFTKDEAVVLLNLLDVAVKAAGLPAAESVAVLAKKVTPIATAPAIDPSEA